jgi:hypothetical protein
MKSLLDTAITDVEALHGNLYRVRIVLSEIRNPAEWTDHANSTVEAIKQCLASVSQQVSQAQAQLAGVLQAREASEKVLGILSEEMSALADAVNRLKTNLETNVAKAA